MAEHEFESVEVPMLDTGIGIEAGYESDEAFMAAMREERAALSPEVRDAVEDFERELQRRVLFGTSDPSKGTR